ncbi:MAG: ATP-binding cassette domain-containing protein [Pseudomonadales bacterium]|nr:ATP-binding cassette domain-containing protein [Pseudomonadales bacterium]
MINLNDATLMRGEHILLDQTSLSIHKGQKIGIIGRNGSGKTSLFACLLGRLALDKGQLLMPEGLRCACMAQETAGLAISALTHVIDGDADYRRIEKTLAEAEARGDGHAIAEGHSELDRIDGYTIQTRARQLLAGLGFSPEQFEQPVSAFSGGWRIRLNLAAALMAPSDLLLLDEPTNHLDLEATLWLEQWLGRYQGTLLIISHDRSFLDKVIDHVVSFEGCKLVLYRGNYSAYELQRSARMALQQAQYEKQQRRRSEMEDFVRRFRAKATKAKQAQSRLKALDRMQEIAPAHVDSPFSFNFLPAEKTADELLALDQASIGFDQPLVSGIRLKLSNNSRIGLLGYNGSGKSTLLKTLSGGLPLLSGEYRQSKHLRIGYFAQHQVDVLDLQASPVSLIQRLDPRAREQNLRDFLGGFDFRGDRINQAIEVFSGGEKARLALALIVWQKPNLLLLDEPTNHLDLEMRHALTMALQAYEGALLIVSHDRHLLSNSVDEFYSIHQGRCTLFEGDLDDYERQLSTLPEKTAPGGGQAQLKPAEQQGRKSQRQQSAAQRQQTASLRKEIAALEKRLDKLGRQLETLESRLADPTLYDAGNKQSLDELLQQQRLVRKELTAVEEQWLSHTETLESVSA